MRRWLIAFLLACLGCLPIVFTHASGAGLLKDTDTYVLLKALETRQAPLSWFASDWPLENHFYRPISTLVFEFDHAVYGGNADGYGMTNAILAAGCVLALFWFVRELTDRVPLAVGSAWLFAYWHLPEQNFLRLIGWLALPVLCLAIWQRRKSLKWTIFLAPLAILFVASLLNPGKSFDRFIVGWIPGRTASTMCLFSLLSLASYARSIRLFARRNPSPPTALEIPSTRSASLAVDTRMPWLWTGLSVLFLLLALGSYEQAVVIPGALLGVAVAFRLRGFRPNWNIHWVFWGTLALYFLVRLQFVPMAASGYQRQQFRSGPAVYVDLLDYFFPSLYEIRILFSSFDQGFSLLLLSVPYLAILRPMMNACALWSVWRDETRHVALFAWLAAGLSFLPVAFLKYFGHYHYLPHAFQALFVVLLIQGVLRISISAISPPAIQAPARQNPESHLLVHQ